IVGGTAISGSPEQVPRRIQKQPGEKTASVGASREAVEDSLFASLGQLENLSAIEDPTTESCAVEIPLGVEHQARPGTSAVRSSGKCVQPFLFAARVQLEHGSVQSRAAAFSGPVKIACRILDD